MSHEGRAVVTIISRDHLHYAYALCDSLRRSNPGLPVFVCLMDRIPADEMTTRRLPADRFFYADELRILNWRRFAFQYTPFELACALKPHAIKRVLQWGFENVLYIDSDIQVYADLTPVFHPMKLFSLFLTPHLCDAVSDSPALSEAEFLRSGTFNGGWIGVSNTDVGHRFIEWWSQKTSQWCINDQARGLFVDQRWLDLVPGLFDKVYVSRNPGLNIGHWAVERLATSYTRENGLLFGGQPLISFHFSGYSPNAPDQISCYKPQLSLKNFPHLTKLFEDYRSLLLASGWEEYSQWNCAYSTLSSGEPILPEWRKQVRESGLKWDDRKDPFSLRYE